VGKGRLTDPAQAQRGEGDAQLAGGQVGVELVGYLAQDAAAPAMQFGDGLDVVARSLTMANSAATKKPLSSTSRKAKMIMPKSANNEARLIPGEGSMMEFLRCPSLR